MASEFFKNKPKDILYDQDLTVEWRDGTVVHYPYFFLRNACPCAKCVDEISGKKMLDPNSIAKDIHIGKADYVGNYALQVKWSDGHDTGIYSFQFLREVFELSLEKGAEEGQPFARAN